MQDKKRSSRAASPPSRDFPTSYRSLIHSRPQRPRRRRSQNLQHARTDDDEAKKSQHHRPHAEFLLLRILRAHLAPPVNVPVELLRSMIHHARTRRLRVARSPVVSHPARPPRRSTPDRVTVPFTRPRPPRSAAPSIAHPPRRRSRTMSPVVGVVVVSRARARDRVEAGAHAHIQEYSSPSTSNTNTFHIRVYTSPMYARAGPRRPGR